MVHFDSHRAVVYGGTSGNTVLDSLYVVDLERRVGEGLMQYSVCMCVVANQWEVFIFPNRAHPKFSKGAGNLDSR